MNQQDVERVAAVRYGYVKTDDSATVPRTTFALELAARDIEIDNLKTQIESLQQSLDRTIH